MNSNYIGINFLSNKQKKLSQLFSNKKNLWRNTKYFLTKEKIPMINNSVVNFSSKKYKTLPNGDHIIFICKIIDIKINESAKPLIYLNSKYF